MLTRSVSINVVPPYKVTIGPGLLSECGERIKSVTGLCHAAVITDSNVAPFYLDKVKESLGTAGFDVSTYTFSAGEANKNLDTLSAILEFLAEEELTRSDCVVALGGGVSGDMAGFAAGCYLRGIRYVQLPTTLLAAVDSSVGGKTAVNLQAGKNLAGLFLQPSAVLCDTDCFDTLPPGVFDEGMAEVIKTAVLLGEELFELCRPDSRKSDIAELVTRCVAYKGSIVAADELEQDRRRLLNLGHTAAHAIERLSGFTIPHGRAVAAGLVIMARAAEKLGWSESPCSGRIADVLQQNGLPYTTGYTASELAGAALLDKKRTGPDITIVVPLAIGKCILKKVPVSRLEEIFRAGLEDKL